MPALALRYHRGAFVRFRPLGEPIVKTRSIAALALAAIFSFPVASMAITTTPMHVTKHKKPKKAINSSRPGSPGYTNSSPLGTAEKADKKAKKRAAKQNS
jgi:hypothetical protein